MDIGWIEVLNLELLVHSFQSASQYIFEAFSLQIVNVWIYPVFK